MKKPFVTKDKLEEIIREIPTPFHLYDEKGIRGKRGKSDESLFLESPDSRNILLSRPIPIPI